jgi:hypothetical protein
MTTPSARFDHVIRNRTLVDGTGALVLPTREPVEGMSLDALRAGLGPAWPFEHFGEFLDAIESRDTGIPRGGRRCERHAAGSCGPRLMRRIGSLVCVLLLGAAAASAQTFVFENFDDGAHDLALFGGAGHTIGGGVSTQSYPIEPDGAGSDLEMRLDLVSLASDETSSVGSYVWPAVRALVPELADRSFRVSAEFEIDEAFAEGPNRSLSVGLVARCAYAFNADNCVSFDASAVNTFYRLSFAIVGEGNFTDSGAALETGELRLVEYRGDSQVDVTGPGLAVPAGEAFTMSLEGTVVGETLVLVGRMQSGASVVEVEGVDPTPLLGPGFGARTGGSVRGFGGANASGALDVDLDDLLVAPEVPALEAGLAALLALQRTIRRARPTR